MNIDVINCIPSATLRAYLKKHPVVLSVLQEATIISAYADETAKSAMFQRLIERSDSEDEKLLLRTELTDPEAACRIYTERFPHEGFPLYPFLEVCNLPVLFRPGDVIRVRGGHGNALYYVGKVPHVVEGRCDFSDESYLCYSLYEAQKMHCGTYAGLSFIHCHIGVCEAERASFRKLTPSMQRTMHIIRKILAQKNRPVDSKQRNVYLICMEQE